MRRPVTTANIVTIATRWIDWYHGTPGYAESWPVENYYAGYIQGIALTVVATAGDSTPTDRFLTLMRSKLANVISQEYQVAGGVGSLVDILNRTDRTTERNVLDELAKADSELAEEIRLLLFTFEDVVKLDDRSIQMVLKEVDQKDLALALRGVSEEVRDKVLSNMSQRAAEMLLEEIEYQPPQLRRVVEEAQGRVVAKVRQLEEAEAIVIGRGGGEDELVA